MKEDLFVIDHLEISLETPVWQRIQREVMELNLFRTREEQYDFYELQTSRLTTRTFFILTFVCILVLSIYTTVMIRPQTIVISDPSQTAFRDLHSKYSSTLKCPCDRIAVEYETFTDLSPRYHSVCSSEFISSAWINSLSPSNWIDQLFEENDFRVYGQIFFNALSTLCNLIELIVSNSWFVFKQSFMITEQVLSDTQLTARSTDALNRFKSDVFNGLHKSSSHHSISNINAISNWIRKLWLHVINFDQFYCTNRNSYKIVNTRKLFMCIE